MSKDVVDMDIRVPLAPLAWPVNVAPYQTHFYIITAKNISSEDVSYEDAGEDG